MCEREIVCVRERVRETDRQTERERKKISRGREGKTIRFC